MGKKKKTIKAVIDTNVLISALLFGGELSKIVDLWKNGLITPLISKETFDEFKKVLAYPKFSLKENEINAIIKEHVLPFFEVTEMKEDMQRICKDEDDDKFISCAVSASADYIVTGDKDFCDLRRYKSVKIISAADFLKMFD